MQSAPNLETLLVVPVKDNSRGINNLVKYLELQTDKSFKLILVDDGSDQPIQKPISQTIDIEIIRLQNNSGPAEARNVGARYVASDLLIFTDSDCLPNPHWIENYKRLYLSGHKIIASSFSHVEKGKIISLLRSDESKFYHLNQETFVNCCSTSNFAIDSKLFSEVRGFPNIRVGEDFLIGYKLFLSGIDIFWYPGNTVKQNNREKLNHYLSQQFEWAKAAFMFYIMLPCSQKMKWNVQARSLKPQILLTGLVLVTLPLWLVDKDMIYLNLAWICCIFLFNSKFLFTVMKNRGVWTAFLYFFVIAFFRNVCWALALFRVSLRKEVWPGFIRKIKTEKLQSNDAKKYQNFNTKVDTILTQVINANIVSSYQSSTETK
jgi:glycosyltransferase involved in cell wall biosynthesis